MIGIVGGGQMGAGIAELAARSSFAVHVVEQSDAAATAAIDRVQQSLHRAVAKGKLSEADADTAGAAITASTDWSRLSECALIVEAVPEDVALKQQVFARLDEISPHAILATNTSSIPIARIAAAIQSPDRVVGMHFFQPVPVMRLVELVAGVRTSTTTLDAAQVYADAFGCHTIRSADRAGFIVNTLLMPYLMSAIRMLESGHASADDIDAGMVLGCAHPMGPLALADFIGLDTCLAIADSLYDEYGDAAMLPPPLLRRMVDAGMLGRKSGIGFRTH